MMVAQTVVPHDSMREVLRHLACYHLAHLVDTGFVVREAVAGNEIGEEGKDRLPMLVDHLPDLRTNIDAHRLTVLQ